MKRPALLAISVLTGLTVAGVPLIAEASSFNNGCEDYLQRGNVIIANGENFNDVKEQLNQAGINLDSIRWGSCPTAPDLELPEVPEVEAPEVEEPEIVIPEMKPPVVEVPETKPPVTEVPETKPPVIEEELDVEDDFAAQVVKLVNKERTSRGLSSLKVDKNIKSAALVRAKETEVSFAHTRPNGSSFSTALKEQEVSFMGSGENIAWGQKSPEDVMKAWMNSEGHRANILNPQFTKIGVGYYQNSKGTNYWTQLFTY